jgi:hypothetical protein
MARFLASVFVFLVSTPCWSAPPDFEGQIAPLLSSHCLNCHSGQKPQGKLDLTSKAAVLNGEIVTPKKLENSQLWLRVEADEMPPKTRLKPEEKALLKEWILAGAVWGRDPIDPLKYTTTNRAGLDWWSLKPLKKTEPQVAEPNPIDGFLEAKRRALQLTTAAPTDRRTLIRRLSYDLLGLPPTPEEVDRFVSNSSPTAYIDLVDKLLASPHYGERWARHWLDIVRYGESDGFERNDPRKAAWHYRDWVIRALNQDKPYSDFVRLQIAADSLKPDDPDSLKALGYLVAGIHNTVLPAQDAARQTARQDELEDIVGNIGQTFLGLSVQCARCHDHKFDPISQLDYYRIAATVSGVTHGERSYKRPESQAKLADLQLKLKALEQEIQQLEAPIRAKLLTARGAKLTDKVGPTPILHWNFQELQPSEKLTSHGGAKFTPDGLVLNGTRAFVRTEAISMPILEKTLEAWVKLANTQQRGGGVMTLQTLDGNSFDSIVFGEQTPQQWMAGSEFFRRTKPFQGTVEPGTDVVHIAITYTRNGELTAYRNGQPYGKSYRVEGLNRFEAGKANLVFGVRHEPAGGGKMLAGTILRASLYDKALTPEEVVLSGKHRNIILEQELLAALPAEVKEQREKLRRDKAALQGELAKLEAAQLERVFTHVPINPPATRFLIRGQVTEPASVVPPAGLSCLPKSDFTSGQKVSEAQRRLRLANWITDPENPLFTRVIVNRVWQHHFGIGLVDTPSDFGFNCGRPSHPELLDWLAIRFRYDGYSLKKLHRLIVTSKAYQQSSKLDQHNFAKDAESRYLWRKRPQRVDAESLRDALLEVSGLLNREVGGQGFNDYRMQGNAGTMYYEPFDPVGPEFHRRSIYRFLPRSANAGLLEAFDCPDPAGSTPRRASTTTPLQALSLWNSDFALRMSNTLAERLDREKGQSADRVVHAYQLCFQRQPTDSEIKLAVELIDKHGLRSLCRALLNSNEFLTIE